MTDAIRVSAIAAFAAAFSAVYADKPLPPDYAIAIAAEAYVATYATAARAALRAWEHQRLSEFLGVTP